MFFKACCSISSSDSDAISGAGARERTCTSAGGSETFSKLHSRDFRGVSWDFGGHPVAGFELSALGGLGSLEGEAFGLGLGLADRLGGEAFGVGNKT